MNSNTLAALGKLRDVDGKSLFSPNPAAGVPMSLLGYGIEIDDLLTGEEQAKHRADSVEPKIQSLFSKQRAYARFKLRT